MMLKKSLLAISLAAAVGVANAGTIQPNGSAGAKPTAASAQTISKQAALSTITGVQFEVLVDKTATVRETYKNATGVTVTISGATLTPASAPELAGVFTANKSDVTYDGNTSFTFKVAGAAATPAATDTLDISGLALAVDGSSSVSVTVTVDSPIDGAAIDTASGTLLTYVDEFSAAAATAGANPVSTAFDGVIAFARTAFNGSTTQDAATILTSVAAIDYPAGGVNKGGVKVTTTLKGDFSYLDADENGTIASTEGSVVSTGATTIAKDLKSVADVASSAGSATFTVTSLAKQVIPAQTFTADVEVDFTNSLTKADSVTLAGIKVGSWTLDGTPSKLAYMPFGPQYAQSITVTNESSVDGEISVTLSAGGKTTEPEIVGIAKGKSVTQIGKAVADIAAANGMTEAAVNITVNSGDARVVGIYYSKADGDRVLTK